jgi:DNA-binding NarL/FixJ family response regulator
MESPRPQVLIADDHVVVADALRVLLEKNCRVVGIVADGRALVREAARLQPDIVIVDVGMPLLNGLDAAKRIREQLPKVKLVFLTMHDDPNLAAAALDLGAVGFVLKQSAGSELLRAIEQVLRGKNYVTSRLRSNDWVVMKQRVRQFSKELTARQRDIVQMCAEGRPIKEIAGHLNLSEKTVEFHKHHIMEAFNLKSNADLVLFALKQGLISLDSRPVQRQKSS